MAKILLPLMTDFEEIEAITVIDILRRAGVEVVTAGLSANPISGAHGIRVEADTGIEHVSAEDFDGIVLPGGKGTQRLREDAWVAALVRALAERGKLTAAICAAPVVLSDAGLLATRRATSHPTRQSELVCAQYLEAPVVRDDFVYTSRGAGTAMAFALELVRRLAGPEQARAIAQAVIADWQPAEPVTV